METMELSTPLHSSQKNLDSQTNISSEYKMREKSRIRKTRADKDQQQFKPNKSDDKKGRKTPQNSNRNVVPNIMHQIISFLQKKSKSEKMVERLINKLQQKGDCTSKRFYLYQNLIKEKLNNYVNADSLTMFKGIQQPLCEVYTEQQQRQYNKISLLLIRYFLTKEFDIIILTSKRVSSNKKLDHLVTKRKILELLQGIH